MEWAIWGVPAGAAFLGLVLFVSGVTRVFRAKFVSGAGQGLTGGLFMALGAAAGLLGLNVQTYNRLSYERPVAEISLRQTGDQAFIATVRLPKGEPQDYPLAGDQWQMDARVLKWKPWANVIGFDAMYRLDRLSGRYAAIEDEREAVRTVHAMAQDPGLDLWTLAQQYGRYAPLVDASYGSGTYLPMADGAVYEVSITQSGLVARPANAAAQAAVSQPW